MMKIRSGPYVASVYKFHFRRDVLLFTLNSLLNDKFLIIFLFLNLSLTDRAL